MADIGDLTKVINANNVKLKLGSNEYITVFVNGIRKSHPISHVATRSGAVDFFGAPTIDVPFEALVTEAVYKSFDALATLNSRGALTYSAMTLLGENIGGSAGDDLTITFSACLPEFEGTAPRDGYYAIRGTLRIKNSTYAVGA